MEVVVLTHILAATAAAASSGHSRRFQSPLPLLGKAAGLESANLHCSH